MQAKSLLTYNHMNKNINFTRGAYIVKERYRFFTKKAIKSGLGL